MMYFRTHTFTLDKKKGFGLIFLNDNAKDYSVFYEDETLEKSDETGTCTSALSSLRRFGDSRSFYRNSPGENEFNRLIRTAKCRFVPEKNGSVTAILTDGKKEITIKTEPGRYGYSVSCSCKGYMCIHSNAAGFFLGVREDQLKKQYLSSDLPVNKGLFLDPELLNMMKDEFAGDPTEEAIKRVHDMMNLLDLPQSPDYYRCFHQHMLNLESSFYGYDAHVLETHAMLPLALLENPGYQSAVIETGEYAKTEEYENRQHRSNRASFKRIIKAYKEVNKALATGCYTDHLYMEFLLKYRNDLPSLFHYYAKAKASLKKMDVPFLMRIASLPVSEKASLDKEVVLKVAKKIEAMYFQGNREELVHGIMAHLPLSDRVEIYGELREFTMPLSEIQKLDKESQKKLIYNTPLTDDSLMHIMDHILTEEESSTRGRFLLYAAEKIRGNRSRDIKETILRYARELPYNYVLLLYFKDEFSDMKVIPGKSEDPVQELTTYFNCDFRIDEEPTSYSIIYTIGSAKGSGDSYILTAEEENDRIVVHTYVRKLTVSPDTVRKACTVGREDEYMSMIEQADERIARRRFEQGHRNFSRDYQRFCESLGREKVILSDNSKAHLVYLLYRQKGSNALAFKVGNTKTYVVKDAPEFIYAFKSGTTEKYGKDLILTHDTENLEKTDAAVMRLLMGAKYSRGSNAEPKNNRYITVNDNLMSNLLELLSGREVFYNETPCRVRLAAKKVRIRVGSDYSLSTDLANGQEYMNLGGKGYIVSPAGAEENRILDRLDGTSEEAELISLITENPGVSIQPILKDFRKNIYSRFFDLFDVDPMVKQDFRLSELQLSSYFDFDNAVITVKVKLKKDEMDISPKQLTERIDNAKYELLLDYLREIGFVENVMEDESRILNFFKMDFSRLKTLTNVYLSENLKKKELLSVGKPTIRVTYDNNIVSAFLEKSDYTDEELAKIIAGLKKKKKFILLSGDRIVDLDSEAARDLGETVEDFGLDPKDLYKKKTISMVTAIKAFAHEKSCKIDKYLRTMIEDIRGFKDADIPVPKISGELREYQEEGYRWLSILTRYHMGGVLADDMGLGKTIQIIALIKADTEKKPSLVVCPKSLLFNWRSEFARFDGKTEVNVVYGTDARRTAIIEKINYKKKAVYVTSYESLRNDITKYKGAFRFGILDEAQHIKNVHAQKTRSVKELTVEQRFALTGTPIENSVVDLWSIFDYILPGYFDELSEFKDMDTSVIARKAAPFILRRVKGDVLEDLPPKYERILSAEMSKEQRKVYDAMRMEAREKLNGGGKAFDMLPYLMRLRQVCVNPAMFLENYTGGSGKMDLLKTLIPSYLSEGHRILIFSQFVKALESVESTLSTLKIPCFFLQGSTSVKDRAKMMDSFNNGNGPDVFLISLKAGGVGLNLTGADTVIHLDPWWNVAAEDQASDRAHRIGQQRNVEIIRLIADNSIEQRVVELQEIKKAVIHEVISDDDGSVTSASLEDIAYILEDEQGEDGRD